MTENESPKAFLQLVGNGEGTIWPLSGKSTFRLGRGAGSDILLPYQWVSRQHAMIQVEENFSHNIVDLGSANGTFVNGRRVYTPTRLHTNDRVKVGKSEFIFVLENWSQEESGEETSGVGDETVAFLQKGMVTVLVCDIRGFTSLSEEIGSGPISEFLAVWSKKVDGIVRTNGGQVDKFIGDAVLAVWTDGQDFSNIIKCLLSALEISIWTGKLGQAMTGIGRELTIGGALNTGEAVMGNIGVDGQRDYTIVGDVVNVTFRLEEMTSVKQVDLLVGDNTFRQLKAADPYFTCQNLIVKGKAGSLTAYSASFADIRKYLSKWKDLLKK